MYVQYNALCRNSGQSYRSSKYEIIGCRVSKFVIMLIEV